MRFDLSDEVQGTWFDFCTSEVKDGAVTFRDPVQGAGRVCLRLARGEVMEEIHRQTRRTVKEFVVNTKSRGMERVEYEDQTQEQKKKENELIWDHAIQAWEGILDKDGNEINCTAANKVKLMTIPQFSRFVVRCLNLLSSASDEEAEGAIKNS